jgi:DNA primase
MIVEVISKYVKLKQSGSNFAGLCPFHNEKTPSFFVSPREKVWHCFGCNLGGDVIGFIMKFKDLSYQEAEKFLKEREKSEKRRSQTQI